MTKTVLFVEDGSVDIDEVINALPGVAIIVYRQGSPMPQFVDVAVSDLCEGVEPSGDK